MFLSREREQVWKKTEAGALNAESVHARLRHELEASEERRRVLEEKWATQRRAWEDIQEEVRRRGHTHTHTRDTTHGQIYTSIDRMDQWIYIYIYIRR
jgi:hypothetical protein